MPKTEPFDRYADKYDNWFIDNKFVFQSESKALKKLFRKIKMVLRLALVVEFLLNHQE